tara:strand:- start:1781 stop:2224 length:444 start_codon:yes stop_codon:yes gene_type:complete
MVNEISIFGSKCRIEIVIICLLVGFIAGGYMLCGCIKPNYNRFEGMENESTTYDKPISTPMNYNPEGGNLQSWYSQIQETDNSSLGGSNNVYVTGDDIKSKDILANTKTDKECPSDLSGYGGMYCVTKEQKDFINMRGGNRTKASNV